MAGSAPGSGCQRGEMMFTNRD